MEIETEHKDEFYNNYITINEYIQNIVDKTEADFGVKIKNEESSYNEELKKERRQDYGRLEKSMQIKVECILGRLIWIM